MFLPNLFGILLFQYLELKHLPVLADNVKYIMRMIYHYRSLEQLQ